MDNGTCIIGMEKKAMMPLIVFDAAVNIYLTALFIYPLRRMQIPYVSILYTKTLTILSSRTVLVQDSSQWHPPYYGCPRLHRFLRNPDLVHHQPHAAHGP